ncbi:MAG: hypothetical protein FWF06_05560 [Symbiobacteriaceae bacterium]|nr:hypothetical protein [Symbiobacteriaceae bacterium]
MITVPDSVVAALQPLHVWLGALATLGMLSLLYRENPFYRFCEYTYVGSAGAHTLVTTFANTIKPGIQTQMIQNGQWWEILPICLGLLIYFQPVKRYSWLSRLPMGYWVGYNAGYALTMRTAMPMLTEVRRSILPPIVITSSGFDLMASINNIVFCTTVVLVMVYFIFSREVLKGRAAVLMNVSRVLIMMALGVGFGNGAITRVSLLIGRLDYLFADWLGIY